MAIVNDDTGAPFRTQRIDIGGQVEAGLNTPPVSSLLSIKRSTMTEADVGVNTGAIYALVVIPPHFTSSLLQLTAVNLPAGATAQRRTIQL